MISPMLRCDSLRLDDRRLANKRRTFQLAAHPYQPLAVSKQRRRTDWRHPDGPLSAFIGLSRGNNALAIRHMRLISMVRSLMWMQSQ
jgi:hypothetical protein